MTDVPLRPFAPPASLPFNLSGAVTAETLVTWFFCFALLYWIVYTLVAVYHWFKYAHSPSVAVPTVALHLFVSLLLIGYAVSGLIV